VRKQDGYRLIIITNQGTTTMSVTIDELLVVVAEYQRECLHTVQTRQWSQFKLARTKFKSWFEEHDMPVTFPVED
jgi:hypothetical protein